LRYSTKVTLLHAARTYLEDWGKPVALYSDKHCVFRVSQMGAVGGDGMTQFGRLHIGFLFAAGRRCPT
jgi:hypothetical protein